MFSMRYQIVAAVALLLCSTFFVGEAQLLRRAKEVSATKILDDKKRGLRYSDESMDHHGGMLICRISRSMAVKTRTNSLISKTGVCL